MELNSNINNHRQHVHHHTIRAIVLILVVVRVPRGDSHVPVATIAIRILNLPDHAHMAVRAVAPGLLAADPHVPPDLVVAHHIVVAMPVALVLR
ncbi:hypothetical protein KSZ_10460 [Dictyobacter formicarum]|uniref:Uncharacterized protein n=1 Tax=Dictyobacter formicarum TaxID=2778368 RepID=A0ABQ3VB74_9CHLR|nr:hypothetical protein KSZ_10460 [Dictyobacter formicarum]